VDKNGEGRPHLTARSGDPIERLRAVSDKGTNLTEGGPACACVSEDRKGTTSTWTISRPSLSRMTTLKFLRRLAICLVIHFRIVAQAVDGLEAFRAINEHTPQLAVLDFSMPKMNGMEVARWLSQATHPTRIVFLTLMTGDDFIREAKCYDDPTKQESPRSLFFDPLLGAVSPGGRAGTQER
jgi:CheY-like chemotaxis protein